MRKVAWEHTTAKDLRVGDIIKLDRWVTKAKTGVVSQVTIVPVAERWVQKHYDALYYKKKAMRRVLVTLPSGKTQLVGYGHDGDEKDLQAEPTMWFERQCDVKAAALKEHQDEILAHRIGVRTVLSRCETDLVQWKRDGKVPKSVEPYWEEYNEIFKRLEALDVRMTKDAGKNDVRKPVHPSGRRRG